MSSSSTSDLDQRIQAALNAAKMALWEVDLNKSEIRWTGKVTGHFFDFSKSFDGTLKGYLDLVHRDDQGELKELIARVKADQPFINQHRVKFPDGRHHWLETIGNVNRESKAVKLTGTVQDISDKKKMELEGEGWREKFELVAKSSGILVYDHNQKKGVTKWSGDTLSILGFQQEDIVSDESWRDNIHPEDYDRIKKDIGDSLAKEMSFEVFYRYRGGDGNYRHLRDIGIVSEAFEDNKVRILGMMEDISERTKAEALLTESERRFKSMILEMNIGIGLYDQKTVPIVCNRKAYELLGMTEAQFLGRTALNDDWQVVQDDGSPFQPADFPIPRAIESGESIRDVTMGVYRPMTLDWVWLSVNAEPIYNQRGDFQHVICTFSDVTDLRTSKKELHEKNEMLSRVATELRGRNERLLEFAQIVSHNLRSPISSIVSLMRIYSEGDEIIKSQAIDHVNLVSRKALTALTELNKVLKIQQEQVTRERVKFQSVLDDVLTSHHGLVTESNLQLEAEFDVKEIDYSRIYLDSIFLNLLSNSIKYRSESSDCKIKIRAKNDKNDDIILSWRDNGQGVDLDKHGNDIFKLGKTFHKNEDSSGVGLFLIKNQIQAMGGTISIESKHNEGCTFKINFTKNLVK